MERSSQWTIRIFVTYLFVMICPATDSFASGMVGNIDEPALGKYSTTIAFPCKIEQIVIPGSVVEAKPIRDRDQPVIVRILETFPHGTDFRYDVEFQILEPGQFDLADFLQRKDRSDQQPIRSIPVQANSLLAKETIEPNQLVPRPSRFSNYYLPGLVVGAALWLAGLLMILFYGRGKTKRPSREHKVPTFAERLEPLVTAAVSGEITTQQQAELERLLSSFWSRKLRLNHLPAASLREQLRNHPEASKLLQQIDQWLHRPQEVDSAEVDVAGLLEPYQSLTDDEI